MHLLPNQLCPHETIICVTQVKFEVLLTSYEVLLKDKYLFKQFDQDTGRYPTFLTIIVDEAHRLKTLTSSTRDVIHNMKTRWLLLLTGKYLLSASD